MTPYINLFAKDGTEHCNLKEDLRNRESNWVEERGWRFFTHKWFWVLNLETVKIRSVQGSPLSLYLIQFYSSKKGIKINEILYWLIDFIFFLSSLYNSQINTFSLSLCARVSDVPSLTLIWQSSRKGHTLTNKLLSNTN